MTEAFKLFSGFKISFENESFWAGFWFSIFYFFLWIRRHHL